MTENERPFEDCNCPTEDLPDYVSTGLTFTGNRMYLIHAPGCPNDD